jgi:hypothetical protein
MRPISEVVRLADYWTVRSSGSLTMMWRSFSDVTSRLVRGVAWMRDGAARSNSASSAPVVPRQRSRVPSPATSRGHQAGRTGRLDAVAEKPIGRLRPAFHSWSDG